MYNISIKESAKKQIRSLPKKQIPEIIKAISTLSRNPRPNISKKLINSSNQYRLRKGDYRVLYTVSDKTKQVVIFRVRHRRDAYR